MKQNLAQVISNVEATPRVHLLWLESPEIAAAAKPGQFVMVDCGEDVLLRRPLSIHKADEAKGTLALLFAIVGKGTNWLSQRKGGDKVDILGPSGNGFTVNPKAKNLLLIGGGLGIAPLAFLAETAAKDGRTVKLHHGVNTAGAILIDAISPQGTPVPISSLTAAAKHSDTIKCTASTVDGSAYTKGLATVCLPGLAGWADQIFACGPMPMYKAMAKMPEIKEKAVQVSLEIVMGCGRGICYGCTIKTKKGLKEVCKDGPVFGMDDIIWEEMK